MIVVIADDFTGAAEIGGIGLRYGLNVEIQTDTIIPDNVDLLIIATDTRSKLEDDAYREVLEITGKLNVADFDLIYKKTDSVLRGHILKELKAFLKATDRKNLIFIPANPNFGRTISDGVYFINDKPLHETGFANDPEFPAKVSNVKDLIGSSEENHVKIAAHCDDKDVEGIIIGEAVKISDLDCWAEKIIDEKVTAGAAGFFYSVLKARGFKLMNGTTNTIDFNNKKCLYVCGSSIESSRKAIEHARNNGAVVSEMPEKLIRNGIDTEKEIISWSNEIITHLENNSKVIIAINKPLIREDGIPHKLRSYIAEVTAKIFDKISIDELFVEGGATTYSIIERNNFKEFIPLQELAHGVLRMRVAGERNLSLTIKPGSYPWPEEIWNFK